VGNAISNCLEQRPNDAQVPTPHGLQVGPGHVAGGHARQEAMSRMHPASEDHHIRVSAAKYETLEERGKLKGRRFKSAQIDPRNRLPNRERSVAWEARENVSLCGWQYTGSAFWTTGNGENSHRHGLDGATMFVWRRLMDHFELRCLSIQAWQTSIARLICPIS
jgi:hypothetical protein